MNLESMIREMHSVLKRDGRIEAFDRNKILNAVLRAAGVVADREGKQLDEVEAEKVTDKIIESLYIQKKYGQFPHSQINIPDIEDIHLSVISMLRDMEHYKTKKAYQSFKEQRDHDREILSVVKERPGESLTDKTLFVVSESKEEIFPWDERQIAFSLMKEADIPEPQAYSIAKETFKRIASWASMRRRDNGKVKIRTARIREFANEVMQDLGLEERLKDTNVLTIPVYDYEAALKGKNKENANILGNNPETVAAFVAELNSKQYMLNNVLSKKVADAHLTGQIHVHDLGYAPRVYCSSHSLANIAKWGMKLDNLSTVSKPAKHTLSLIGHLATFLASMQAYYAGALGIAYINDVMAPYLEADIEDGKKNPRRFKAELRQGMNQNLENLVNLGISSEAVDGFGQKQEENFSRLSTGEEFTEEDEQIFLKQDAQFLIFTLSQMAFSRGGQTLFLDANIHTGTPDIIRNNPAIGPGGKYHLRINGDLIPLEEKLREDRGHLLSTLYLDGRKIMDEHLEERNGKIFLKREQFIESGEKVDAHGDHEPMARKFAKAMLTVWGEGDGVGGVFPFPKCDLHINENSFEKPEQREILDYACQISSENGTPYFVFDREATTLSACCRLRTTIEDDYMIKHLESLRFCGFQNVTINLPQAAYKAGKENREGFIQNIKEGIDLAIEAHQQKKRLISSIGDEGGAQHQTQKLWFDRQPYIDLDKATYIVGLIGLNEAYQYIYGKELHEGPEIIDTALEDIAEAYAYLKKRGKETGMKLSFEETPAESTSRRLAKLDLRQYEEAKEVVKGSVERDEVYYTNSIHLRADAPVSLTARIRTQSLFHQLIESGAILHAFVGEERPPASSIYNLVEKTWKDTQAAQLTISPEFTYCSDCGVISPGIKLKGGVENVEYSGVS